MKITVLLCVLIFIISYIQSYFPPERSKRILGRFHGIWANIVSALLGTVTPFCSCSSIPLFIGFTSAGLPLGVTFSFLISSPMVDLGSLVLLISIFGAKVAIVYVILGLVIAVVGGTIIEKLRMEKYVESFVLSAGKVDIESPDLTKRERLTYAKEQMLSTFKKVFPYGKLLHLLVDQPLFFFRNVKLHLYISLSVFHFRTAFRYKGLGLSQQAFSANGYSFAVLAIYSIPPPKGGICCAFL